MDNTGTLVTLGTQDTWQRQTKQKTQHRKLCTNINKQHNKTWNLLQTSGGKEEPNIVFMGKSLSIPQHGTKNVKTHNRTI